VVGILVIVILKNSKWHSVEQSTWSGWVEGDSSDLDLVVASDSIIDIPVSRTLW
jgi:hypothetical protein